MTLGPISAHTASAGKPFPKNGRCWMSVFTFEIVRHGEAPAIADVLTLPDERAIWCRADAWLSDERAIWCRAEGLALGIENTDSAFIRVKNSEGATVVRTGVTTALVSIEKVFMRGLPPQKRVRAPCLSRGVTPQLILAFRCNSP